MQLTFRDAFFDDIPHLAGLITELGYPTSLAEMEERFKDIATHADYKTIIALAGDEIVAVAGLCKGLFYEMNGPYMRILVFVVKQSHRGRGIGKQLLQQAEAWAAEQGLKTILINSGNRHERIAAHLFYKQMGYEVKSSGFVKRL
jgi:GNAT superfamily N-acetyltransferase